MRFLFLILPVVVAADLEDIRFVDCPKTNFRNPCKGFLFDCLSGCAINNMSEHWFSWNRVMKVENPAYSLADVQAQKKCLSKVKITNAIAVGLQKASSQISTSGGPCIVTGNTWRYTYANFLISRLTRLQCDYVGAELKGLAMECQNWKASASKLGQWLGIGFGCLAGVILIGIAAWCFWKRRR